MSSGSLRVDDRDKNLSTELLPLEMPMSVVNEMPKMILSPNLEVVLDKCSDRISLPHDMDTISLLGSLSLISSSSEGEVIRRWEPIHQIQLKLRQTSTWK
ncbi:hypothetical protein ZOSMA_113G00100 [Zostera marina]|uniref:Uncharacterized protein n=1 Tax=Zostera marina TaxID=29655 RepID=A0A0K9Q4Y6_ZOSMR|nr:hypothetical protein ZOSMA_113G00100 [Zostera marina]